MSVQLVARQEEEAAISWVFNLTPLVSMPFGIICTVTPTAKDQNGTIRQKLTIRLPLWDENDARLYEAKLTESGHGIILTMPSAPCFMRKLDNVKAMNDSWKIFEQQTIDLHVAYCNKVNETAMPIVKVLLLFPTGETYNNKSFNGDVSNEFKLQRKWSVIYEDTIHPVVNIAMRTTIAFEAALDHNDGLNANIQVDALEDVTQMLFRMNPYTPPANRGGQPGMSGPWAIQDKTGD